jgi:methyl-accepting chemotaxis protein
MSDLARAVRINEEIKHITSASRQISLVALNALITARQAGVRSRGFAVVSRELRMLAARLETAMEVLDGVISALANNLAESLKAHRTLASIETTVGSSDSPHASLWPALSTVMHKHDEFKNAVARDWLHLQDNIRTALRMTEIGGALSRSAKIEAAYGGEMTQVLTQVAEQIETTVGEIVVRLRGIRSLTTE